MIAKATVIEAADHGGPVSADCGGEWGEGYSSEIAAMIEACHDAGEPIPAYCHPCTEHPLRIDPVAILEHAVEEMHEDAFDQIVDADGLIEFIEEWNRKQTSVCYHEDRSRVIIIDKVRVQDILERPNDQCRGKEK
jgi:hypothetical protein